MRVVVYSPPNYRSLVQGAVGIPVELHATWLDFERAVRGADCAVSVIESLSEMPGAVELHALRVAHPWTGFVLVVPMDGENALLAPAAADSIVWLSRARSDLNKAVLHAAAGLRIRLAMHVNRESRLSLTLTRAIVALLEAEPAPQSVAAWSEIPTVSCDPATLRYHFRRELPSGLHPKLFVDIGLLLFALDRFPAVASWAALAAKTAADDTRLRRVAARLAGRPAKRPTALNRPDILSDLSRLLASDSTGHGWVRREQWGGSAVSGSPRFFSDPRLGNDSSPA